MKTVICSICGKEFKSERSLNGHMKVHKPDYENQKKRFAEQCKALAQEQYEKDKAEYDLNPLKCLVCGKPISFERAVKRHVKLCSPSCVVTWGNIHRDARSEEAKEKIRKGVTKFWKTAEGKQRIKEQTKIRICGFCGKEFIKKKGAHTSNKYCSTECSTNALSKKRIDKIVKDGGSNFSTKWELNYRDKLYKCDSLLEAAAIIWLIDNLNADNIERAQIILEFVASDNKTHRYNPDFLAKIGDETYIIEVKQDWDKTTKTNDWHRYSLFWEEKKKVLADYADENGYKWMWLNPNYDIEFRKLYRKIQRDKKLYNLTKIKNTQL